MAGFLDHLEARARDQPAVGEPVIGGHHPVARAPQHQRRHPDPAEPVLELRVVHVGVPGIEAQRLPVARVDDQLLVAHRIVIGRLRRVVPAAAADLGRVGVEDVEDIAGLAVADLDADRVDEDQLAQPVAGGDRDLRRQPAAEGQPEQCDPLVGQFVEDGEIEMHQIVDRVEIGRPPGVAEPGRGRGDDLGIAAEQVEERRLRVHRVHAVQQEDGRAGAVTQHLQLDPVDGHPLGRHRRATRLVLHRIMPRTARRTICVGRAGSGRFALRRIAAPVARHILSPRNGPRCGMAPARERPLVSPAVRPYIRALGATTERR